MAAHGLTIMRQVLKQLEERPLLAPSYAESALSAPGTCCTAGFLTRSHTQIAVALDALKGGADLGVLRLAVEEAAEAHAWMEVYRTYEEVRAAWAAYVRWGTPYCNKRANAFEGGDKNAHIKARTLIQATYPISPATAGLLREWVAS